MIMMMQMLDIGMSAVQHVFSYVHEGGNAVDSLGTPIVDQLHLPLGGWTTKIT